MLASLQNLFFSLDGEICFVYVFPKNQRNYFNSEKFYDSDRPVSMNAENS